MLDMREYGLRIVTLTRELTVEAMADEKGWPSRAALERGRFIIGEAANRVPREVQVQFPEIPWAAIIGLRNVLAHGYESVSAEKLWRTATESVPGLLKHLDAAIEKQPPFEV